MTRKSLFSLVLSSLLLCYPAIGSCKAYSITEEQMAALEIHLNALQTNNEMLLNLLKESSEDLTIAQNESLTLTQELENTQKQLDELQIQLNEVKKDSAQARKSLEIANQELQTVCESVQKLEAKKNRIEKQRNFWEFVACIATIWGISR